MLRVCAASPLLFLLAVCCHQHATSEIRGHIGRQVSYTTKLSQNNSSVWPNLKPSDSTVKRSEAGPASVRKLQCAARQIPDRVPAAHEKSQHYLDRRPDLKDARTSLCRRPRHETRHDQGSRSGISAKLTGAGLGRAGTPSDNKWRFHEWGTEAFVKNFCGGLCFLRTRMVDRAYAAKPQT